MVGPEPGGQVAASSRVSRPQPGRGTYRLATGPHRWGSSAWRRSHPRVHLPFHLPFCPVMAFRSEHLSLPTAPSCQPLGSSSAASCARNSGPTHFVPAPHFTRGTRACEGQTSSLNWVVLKEGGLEEGARSFPATQDSCSSRPFV